MSPFDLLRWITENPDRLKPPTAAHTLFRGTDFMVTVVGGPNTRTDYHVNPTEEFFFQLKGTLTLRTQQQGRVVDIAVPEGSIYLLPALVPHAPQRPAGSVGLILERVRAADHVDCHRWHCQACNHLLFEKSVHIEVLERDMPPVFDAYYADPAHQRCTACGHVNPGRP